MSNLGSRRLGDIELGAGVLPDELSPSIADTLTFVDEATGFKEVHVTVSQTLNFVQATDNTRGPFRVAVHQVLSFVQNGVPDETRVNQGMAFIDSAGVVHEVTVNQTLTFSDEAERKIIGEDTLHFVDVATAGKGAEVDDILKFTDLASANLVISKSVADTLVFQDVASYYVVRSCIELMYSPAIGGTVAGYTAPSPTAPTLTPGTLTLTYPFVSPTTTLLLRNPDFSNRDRLSFNRINRETRGGTLIVFADPMWPKQQNLILQISIMSAQMLIDFKTFLALTLGDEIGLLDWEGRQWRGIITNPDGALTHVGRGNRSVSIEFQGMLA